MIEGLTDRLTNRVATLQKKLKKNNKVGMIWALAKFRRMAFLTLSLGELIFFLNNIQI